MPFCTVKFSKAAKRRSGRADLNTVMFQIEARTSEGDVELWDGDSRLCALERWGEGVWRVTK